MNKFFKTLTAVFLAATTTIGSAAPPAFATESPLDESTNVQQATQNPDMGDLKCKSAILMELSTGNILYQDNIDQPLPPASVTKIMTMLLVMEEIENGTLHYDQMISASEHACSMGGSQIWLEPNEQMSIDDLLKATAVNSANDASVLLAETVAGSEEAFVERMNQKAQQLGMTNTTFKNASGLDADGHVTTARDIAIMSRELLTHKDITNYTTIWQGQLRGGETALTNTNKLVRFYDGITGLKTGTTDGAGHCLSASAQRGELAFVAVIMGSDNTTDRNNAARKLLDYGFANYTAYTPQANEQIPSHLLVKGGSAEHVPIGIDQTGSIVIKKNQLDKIESTIELSEQITAPVAMGQTVGTITYSADGNELCQMPIVTKAAVNKLTFWGALYKLLLAMYR